MGRYILAIDQGTTSSRAMLFRDDFSVAAIAQEKFPQHFPKSGWVEHDPEDIWRTVIATTRAALAAAGAAAADIVAIGIANQRETVVVWDGPPAGNQRHRWQDQRRRSGGSWRGQGTDGGRRRSRPAAVIFLRHRSLDPDRVSARDKARARSPSGRSTRSCCGS
jgi:hypothetical protein